MHIIGTIVHTNKFRLGPRIFKDPFAPTIYGFYWGYYGYTFWIKRHAR